MTKRKHVFQIALLFAFLWVKSFLINHVTVPWDENLIIIASYLMDVLLIVFITVGIDKEPISNIGIKAISLTDIFGGFVLGLFLYLVQVLPPVVFLHMDISQFTEPPQWLPLLSRFLFLIATVGLGEELVFRGYLLHKIEGIVSFKAAAVLINCLLFYAIHLTNVFVLDWTQVYSTFATTIVLSGYFYCFKKKSILPLIIAHALLDLLLGAPGFYFLNLFMR